MRTLVHLSDLHFGRTDPALIEPLIASVNGVGADLVVVSGDLTQRAQQAQFEEARDFLASLPPPRSGRPGQPRRAALHASGSASSAARQLLPNHRRDLEPTFVDGEIAVVGINTARSLTFKDGRINHEQMARSGAASRRSASAVTKVVVTHHPFDLPDQRRRRRPGRPRARGDGGLRAVRSRPASRRTLPPQPGRRRPCATRSLATRRSSSRRERRPRRASEERRTLSTCCAWRTARSMSSAGPGTPMPASSGPDRVERFFREGDRWIER